MVRPRPARLPGSMPPAHEATERVSIMSDIIETLPILVIVDPDPINPDKPGHTAQCPHCGVQGDDIVREIDEAVRWNTGELVIEDGKIVAANWGRGEENFEHARYECDHCGKPVALPDNIDEDWG